MATVLAMAIQKGDTEAAQGWQIKPFPLIIDKLFYGFV